MLAKSMSMHLQRAPLQPLTRCSLRVRPVSGPLLATQRHGGRSSRLCCRAAAGSDDPNDIMKKYGLSPGGSSAGSPSSSQPSSTPARQPATRSKGLAAAAATANAGNGVYFLLLANVLIFAADHLVHLPFIKALYLNHLHPMWYQWVGHAFCHANWAHLSANLFQLCVFGRLVEETEGSFGVIFTYLVTALGAAAASYLTTPAVYKGAITVSVGASGAIFGLFAVSVLTRLRWDLKSLLEAGILGQFVVQQVLSEAKAQAAGGLMIKGLAVSHVAHLGGALAGVLLVLLVRMLPEGE